MKRQEWLDGLNKNKTQLYVAYRRLMLALDTEAPSQRMENNIPANRKQKKVGITTLKSEKQRRKGNETKKFVI